jgi:hypothetical protein
MLDAFKPSAMLRNLRLLLGLFFQYEVEGRHGLQISVLALFYQI